MRNPPSSISLYAVLLALLILSSGNLSASDSRDPAADETEWLDALLPRPALCPPMISPPARILPAWQSAAARERAAAPQTVVVQAYEPSWDDEAWDYAGSGLTTVPAEEARPTAPVDAEEETTDSGALIAEADFADLQRGGISRLEGDAWIQQGEQFLNSDVLEFEEDTGLVRALSPATFGTRQMIIDSDSAVYNTQLGEGFFEGVEFYLPQHYARGSATTLARTGEFTASLEGVKYSTCPPEKEDWWLKAGRMEMDQETGRGTGRNVRVAFKGVPFFYVPWISFPIDDRRMSGFLFPDFGESGRNGAWLSVPYYLNLAPNYDATITPHYMDRRGLRLDGQFRYLFPWGQGVAETEYLDEDRVLGERRYYHRLSHRTALPGNWRFSALYQRVSDEEYVQDFSESGRATLVSHLPQTVTFSKSELMYGATVRYQRFQTVDPTIPEARRPYEKWPEIGYYYAPQPLFGDIWFQLDGESVNFQRDNRLEGWRHHVAPAFSTDIGYPALRMTPRVAWWHTEYDLVDPADETVNLSRTVPVASLDMRSRFARRLSAGGSHTLEPRLYYLHVPYRDQDAIPLFDTRVASDSLGTLFRENRFTGPDRVGDENRVTLGLGSRLIDTGGREWFSAQIARAWHLEDRRVTLRPNQEPPPSSVSDYYGRLKYLPSERQNVQLDLSWDPGSEQVNAGSLQYQFRPADDTVLNLSYLFRRERNAANPALEQAGISFAAPIRGRWQVFGKAIYSIEDERSQETMYGFEYESCCWMFRAVKRRYIYNREGDFDTALWFQLELKGMSSVGRRIDDFLVDDIYGYGETQ